jgi:hypothetical protein
MTLFKNKYRIESARLQGWNYTTPGYYFVTDDLKPRIIFDKLSHERSRFGRGASQCVSTTGGSSSFVIPMIP